MNAQIAGRTRLLHPAAEELLADLKIEADDLIKKLEFALIRADRRLTALTVAGRELVAAHLEIIASPGHYSPAKDVRYEKAFAALIELLTQP